MGQRGGPPKAGGWDLTEQGKTMPIPEDPGLAAERQCTATRSLPPLEKGSTLPHREPRQQLRHTGKRPTLSAHLPWDSLVHSRGCCIPGGETRPNPHWHLPSPAAKVGWPCATQGRWCLRMSALGWTRSVPQHGTNLGRVTARARASGRLALPLPHPGTLHRVLGSGATRVLCQGHTTVSLGALGPSAPRTTQGDQSR